MIESVLVSAIADIHGYLPILQHSDLAVICGDIFPGDLDKDADAQGEWFHDAFLPWVERHECHRVILIAGNHDHWIAANNERMLQKYTPEAGNKLIYLSSINQD